MLNKRRKLADVENPGVSSPPPLTSTLMLNFLKACLLFCDLLTVRIKVLLFCGQNRIGVHREITQLTTAKWQGASHMPCHKPQHFVAATCTISPQNPKGIWPSLRTDANSFAAYFLNIDTRLWISSSTAAFQPPCRSMLSILGRGSSTIANYQGQRHFREALWKTRARQAGRSWWLS